jgi:hypothetical protein
LCGWFLKGRSRVGTIKVVLLFFDKSADALNIIEKKFKEEVWI